MDNGWIKIHRKILDWEWYDDPIIFKVFFHLLLQANHQPKNWRGVAIQRGQLVTSREQLTRQLTRKQPAKISVQQVRTALNKLKSTNEITIETTTKYSLITLLNYEKYQYTNPPLNQQVTNKQPTTNPQLNHKQEDKNVKNDKNVKKHYGEFEKVLLTLKEYERLTDLMGKNNVEILVFELDTYIASTGKQYKSHYATLQSWARRKSTELKSKKQLII